MQLTDLLSERVDWAFHLQTWRDLIDRKWRDWAWGQTQFLLPLDQLLR